MQPAVTGLTQSQSLNDVANMLHPPTSNFHATVSREFQEAAAHRKRDSGSMHLFLDPKRNATYVSPRGCLRRPGSPAPSQLKGCFIDGSTNEEVQHTARQPRLHGNAGLENLNRSRNTEVAVLMKTMKPELCETPRPKPRVLRDEAEANALKQIYGSMKLILDADANKKYQDPRKAMNNVTREAKENYEKNTGSHVAGVMHPVAKGNTGEAQERTQCTELTRKNRRPDTCGQVIAGQVPGDPLPEARVKYGGKEIYEKNRGTLTALMAEYGRSAPDLDRPRMQRFERGGGSMKKLMNDFEKLPPKPKPSYRVRSADARQYARNCNGSSMTDYFSDKKPYKGAKAWPN